MECKATTVSRRHWNFKIDLQTTCCFFVVEKVISVTPKQCIKKQIILKSEMHGFRRKLVNGLSQSCPEPDATSGMCEEQNEFSWLDEW